ncbi:Protein smg7 [Gryganskiella cystojenkinii]|nr:Protein smg7 [Gryganskiella cystojenkinii]
MIFHSDAAVLEQSIQQHVEANKVGFRSSNSSHPSSPSGRSSNRDGSPQSQQSGRRGPTPVQQPPSKRSNRQNQQSVQDDPGFQIPASTFFRSGHEELTFLRDSLKDVFETVLLADLVAAVEKSVDERLWRHVFYTPIEELRAELRKLDRTSARRQEVLDELSKLLDKGTGFYHEVITTLRCDHDLDLNSVAVEVLNTESAGGTSSINNTGSSQDNSRGSQGRTRNGRARQQSRQKDQQESTSSSTSSTFPKESLANCVQKCFVYLGDLARYRTNIRLEAQSVQNSHNVAQPAGALATQQVRPTASDWKAAGRFYQRAIQIYPDSAKPYGQMAILASYASDDLDALYWYSLSLGAKSPSVVNRYKEVLMALTSSFSDHDHQYQQHQQQRQQQQQHQDTMDTYSDSQPHRTRTPAESCDLLVLFIKIQMDLFTPQLERLGEKLMLEESGGFELEAQKMVIATVLIVWDLLFRTLHTSNGNEMASKIGVQGMKQAQRTGLIFLLQIATVLLERQLMNLQQQQQQQAEEEQSATDGNFTRSLFLHQTLMFPIQMFLQFWISHWDQIWGMIRLEEKWASSSSSSSSNNKMDFSLRSQLSVTFDTAEVFEETIVFRFRYFADKVIQASEGIRGTVIELSIAPVSEEEPDGPTHYRLLDADDKRVLRERGSKLLASHWLQDQVTTLQKGLEESEYSRRPVVQRSLVPVSTIPGTVRLPTSQAINARASGQTVLTDHYQRGGSRSRESSGGRLYSGSDRQVVSAPIPSTSRSGRGQHQQQQQQSQKFGPPQWTCVVDFSVLVWHLSEVKSILDKRRCLLIIPLDVIDRLDQAKKGGEKENQRAREAIRFLDDRLNIPRWGMSEPLLVGQNVKDCLSRWSEAVPFLVQLEEALRNESDLETEGKVEEDGDTIMNEVDATSSLTDPEASRTPTAATATTTTAASTNLLGKRTSRDGTEEETDDNPATGASKTAVAVHGTDTDEIIEEEDDEEEVEVRNTMNVPRPWRPILGACLFMIHKREESQRIPEEKFVLLTEDQDLTYFASWFAIPTSGIHEWKQKSA